MVDILEKVYFFKEEVFNVFRFYAKMMLDSDYNSKETRVKILTPKQLLQRLPIALPQAKAGSDSEVD